jgi:general secretion pathway protein A
MFWQFFGLKDDPFKLAFDPSYLFMGRHHEEATAHLRYAVAEEEGFTVILGERGVGKSTICRAFMDSIAAETSTAFLASPLPTAKDLLKRMNLQLGIPAAGKTTKDRIDDLNKYLMQQRLAGRKVAVFIDDAQTLALEVLEQVRLITNLETTRDKLILIVLIGEPELMKMIDSRELRQLGQRVSVCYEIRPLAAAETASYIQHRLSIASAGPPVRFDPAAVKLIFRYSRGNPFRINIACNAALMGALKARQKGISAAIAQTVIQDLERQETGGRSFPFGRQKRAWMLAAVLGIVLAATAAFFTFRQADKRQAFQENALSVLTPLAPAPEPAPAALPAVESAQDSAAAAAASPAAPLEENPSTPPTPIPPHMTYSVQVSACLHPEYAQDLAAQLSAKGYSAKVFPVSDAKGRTWHTVRIGDHPSRQAARAQADDFSRREHMEAVVRPFGRL